MYKSLLNKTILIAEDDSFSYKLLVEYFSGKGVKLLHAKTGHDAVHICIQNPNIDLILMDIKLPELDGIQATKQIRAFMKHVPIIAQTAGVMIYDINSYFNCGINDYITKPYKQSDLLLKVCKFISKTGKIIV